MKKVDFLLIPETFVKNCKKTETNVKITTITKYFVKNGSQYEISDLGQLYFCKVVDAFKTLKMPVKVSDFIYCYEIVSDTQVKVYLLDFKDGTLKAITSLLWAESGYI